MTSALGDIKVLDLTGMGPASFAAQMLADMGADVIKVSTPPGASSKGVGAGIEFMDGVDAPAFLDSLRNKKNIGINLKNAEGRQAFERLAKTTDVLIESFRPGVMDRLGVGYRTLSRTNPRLIFCSVSGYGQNSPYRDLPGHDANYSAMSGALGLVGHSEDTPPVQAENFLADMAAAVLQAVVGVLGAICARERTGRGQLVDISMTDGALFLLSSVPEVAEYLMKGADPEKAPVPRRGQTLFGGAQPCYSVYETSDGKYISIGALEPHFWKKLCQALDREDLIPVLFPPSPRKEALFEELRAIFRTRTRDEWFDLLTKADVPVGKVLGIDEVCRDPHMLERQMIVDVDHPRMGKVKQIGFPIKFSDTPWELRLPTARLGDHTEEVFSGLGYSPEDIDRLRREGAIC